MPLGKILEGEVERLTAGESPICLRCKQPLPLTHYSLNGQERTVYGPCPCRVQAYEADMTRIARQAKEREVERLFPSDLGPRLENCTFQTWIPRAGTAACLDAAVAYAREFDKHLADGSGLLFYGGPGNGKSHLAEAVKNHVKAEGRICISRSVPSLLKRIQECYDPQPKIREADIYQALRECDLLVLDDLGAEQSVLEGAKRVMTPWAESTLYLIVDERYRWKKPTVFTTNCTLQELKERIGDRTYSRLLEMCEFYQNKGKDFRQQRALIH